MLEAGEGGDEHEQRGARQVKVGQQGIDHPEAEPGRDEQAGLTRPGLDLSGLVDRRFERAHRGGSDRHHSPAFGFCRIEALRRFPGNFKPLGAHVMVFDLVHGDGTKRPGPDVQRDGCELNALMFEGGE